MRPKSKRSEQVLEIGCSHYWQGAPCHLEWSAGSERVNNEKYSLHVAQVKYMGFTHLAAAIT